MPPATTEDRVPAAAGRLEQIPAGLQFPARSVGSQPQLCGPAMGAEEGPPEINEGLFREVNERIQWRNETSGMAEAETEFVCECGDPNCRETIRMTLDDYASIRRHTTRFVAALGHADPGRVVVCRCRLPSRGPQGHHRPRGPVPRPIARRWAAANANHAALSGVQPRADAYVTSFRTRRLSRTASRSRPLLHLLRPTLDPSPRLSRHSRVRGTAYPRRGKGNAVATGGLDHERRLIPARGVSVESRPTMERILYRPPRVHVPRGAAVGAVRGGRPPPLR
jgi:hypothetical protein